MADVATSGSHLDSTRKEGTIVVGAMLNGNSSKNNSNNTAAPTPVTVIEVKLTNRLDDPQYYTA